MMTCEKCGEHWRSDITSCPLCLLNRADETARADGSEFAAAAGRRLDPALMEAVIAEDKAWHEMNDAERRWRIARARTARESARVQAAESPTDEAERQAGR
jgi:predicted pyridoxine 5'-phosphate oxidase superfamily flavin-nucleotide-binding protein